MLRSGLRPDPKKPVAGQAFVDRTAELAGLRQFVEEEGRGDPLCCVYETSAASGFTSFFHRFLRTAPPETVVLYADGANEVSNNLFFQVIWGLRTHYPDLFTGFMGSVRGRAGKSRSKRLLEAAAQCVPYAGPLLGEAMSLQFERTGIDFSEFPSAVAELLCAYLIELSTLRRVALLIDNAQSVDPWSMDLIRSTASRGYANLRYVVGHVSRPTMRFALDELSIRFESIGYGVRQQVFPRPGLEFLVELAPALGQDLDKPSASRILARSKGDVYRMLALLRRRATGGGIDEELPDERLTPLGTEIVALLTVARQALRLSDLVALCTNNPILFMADVGEVDATVQDLAARKIAAMTRLPGGDQLIALTGPGNPAVVAATRDTARTVVVADRLYRFFAAAEQLGRGRHSASETAPLLYRLAKVVDHAQVSRRARSVLGLSLNAGSVEGAREFIREATDRQTLESFQDYFLLVVFHIAVRDHDRALALLEHPPSALWTRHRYFRILRAVCLNRVRRHWEADALFDRLLSDATSPTEMVVLISFRISGRIHENDLDGARSLFQHWRTRVAGAQNYGYLLRNASAAFSADQALAMLNRSLDHWDRLDDPFGYYTTINNRGARRCDVRDWGAAHQDFASASAHLEVFGVNHLHIVENNLGLCSTHRGDVAAAEHHLRRSLLLARSAMPSVYASLNLALVHALNGQHAACRSVLDRWASAVRDAPFDRMRQKYYVNRGLLAAHEKRPSTELDYLAHLARAHPDRADPSLTNRAVDVIEGAARGVRQVGDAELLSCWSPCYLEYWYQSPLELLPEHALASDTLGEDVADEFGVADSNVPGRDSDAGV